MSHRVLIPFATAEGTELADHPDTEPEAVYAILAKAGHDLWWSETARARMPLPDERNALNLPEATPLLLTARVTHGNDDRPLILEDLRVSGDRAQAAYRIAAETQRQLRAARP